VAKKAMVLLSSGLDSTVNLYWACQEFDLVSTVTFDYGQKAVRQEVYHAQLLAEKLKTSHEVIDIRWLGKVSSSGLTDSSMQVPTGPEVDIDSREQSMKTAAAVWVPNRNGVFLNIAASLAESQGARWVIPGFNREEAATFPDNTVDFIDATNKALEYSTNNRVQVKCFTADLDKTEIVRVGVELGVDFSLVWPCYYDKAEICRECESCQRFLRAMKAAGVAG